MPVTKEQKAKVIAQHKLHDKDTGSPEVQIALLTERVNMLTEHLKEHKKDWKWSKPRYPRTDYPKPERGVPEPTAALLFGLGAVVVAARARKSR